jgi:hypothetical protein
VLEHVFVKILGSMDAITIKAKKTIAKNLEVVYIFECLNDGKFKANQPKGDRWINRWYLGVASVQPSD